MAYNLYITCILLTLKTLNSVVSVGIYSCPALGHLPNLSSYFNVFAQRSLVMYPMIKLVEVQIYDTFPSFGSLIPILSEKSRTLNRNNLFATCFSHIVSFYSNKHAPIELLHRLPNATQINHHPRRVRGYLGVSFFLWVLSFCQIILFVQVPHIWKAPFFSSEKTLLYNNRTDWSLCRG